MGGKWVWERRKGENSVCVCVFEGGECWQKQKLSNNGGISMRLMVESCNNSSSSSKRRRRRRRRVVLIVSDSCCCLF